VVATASPVASPSGRLLSRRARQASRIARPPARWIAPSTPPPPRSEEFAALTIASAGIAVMSPVVTETRIPRGYPTLTAAAGEWDLSHSGMCLRLRDGPERRDAGVVVPHPG